MKKNNGRVLRKQRIVSNQIIFFGLRSIKDYYKRPGGVAGVYGKGHLGVSFFTWVDVC